MPDAESNIEEVRARFGATAGLVVEHAQRQIELVREQVRSFIAPSGDEHALDAGTGAGTLALALAPLVRDVVGVDIVPELLERARDGAPDNVTFVEGDVTKLPFEAGTFDLSCSRRTLHHIARPERAVAELARVTAPGGRVFVDDQIASVDPLVALELDRFERAERFPTPTSAACSTRTISSCSALSFRPTHARWTTTSIWPGARARRASAHERCRPAGPTPTSRRAAGTCS
ncbi:MAG: class I SAM-dependent methyltransferase [Actinobacteria bacterium]|nr:MAG: class I SAM-dependent methyltransferase [Actinomycetota bacterium]